MENKKIKQNEKINKTNETKEQEINTSDKKKEETALIVVDDKKNKKKKIKKKKRHLILKFFFMLIILSILLGIIGMWLFAGYLLRMVWV